MSGNPLSEMYPLIVVRCRQYDSPTGNEPTFWACEAVQDRRTVGRDARPSLVFRHPHPLPIGTPVDIRVKIWDGI